jgi:hypothetical protein
MDSPNEIDYDISKYTANLDPMIVEMIRMSERVRLFSKLRNLIYEKQYDDDRIAEGVLGWAYEKLSDS